MAILPNKQTRTRFCTQNGCTKLYLKLTNRLFAITALTHKQTCIQNTSKTDSYLL